MKLLITSMPISYSGLRHTGVIPVCREGGSSDEVLRAPSELSRSIGQHLAVVVRSSLLHLAPAVNPNTRVITRLFVTQVALVQLQQVTCLVPRRLNAMAE
ncbi:MAG: hypothetical protein QM722_07530 [Piscinibacter sp.]